MPADFTKTVTILPRFSFGDYHALMRSWKNLSGFESNQVAQFRLKAINHLYLHGWRSACHAFEVPKSTLFDWKKCYEHSRKRLNSLVPKSTRPKHTRFMVTDVRMVELIRSIREEYGRVSKYKLRVFLDEYAKTLGVSSYGLDKISRIIKRNNYFFDRPLTHKHRVKLLSSRLKYAPKPTAVGYVEMDSITVYFLGKTWYFITAIDIVTKFAWCRLTSSLSSKQAALAYQEFVVQYQHPVSTVQTDNGHEFLGEFDDYLKQQNIPHQFIYPRSPKINGVVERFNRTIQDEFLLRNTELYVQRPELFSLKLVHYLTWYNTKRPHISLKLMTPLNYLAQLTTT